MADKNICTVNTLTEMTNNTNVIVEENGVLNKLNLKNGIQGELDSIFDKIELVTVKKEVTLDANAYCAPFTHYKHLELPSEVLNDDKLIAITSVYCTVAGVNMSACYTGGNYVACASMNSTGNYLQVNYLRKK